MKLEANKWYAWQMLPGYGGEPYYSPIWVVSAVPLKTGRGDLSLEFYNACYAAGVRDFRLDLLILWDNPEYLIAAIVRGQKETPDRCAIICEVSYLWLSRNLPEILEGYPRNESERDDSSVSRHLDRIARLTTY